MSTESKRIMVAYATRYGSTREVAEAVAAILREEGLEPLLQLAQKVGALNGHRALVVGAPLYLGSWHKEALRLLARQQEAAAGPGAWRCSLSARSKTIGKRCRRRVPSSGKRWTAPWLEPLALEVFCGRYDPAKLRIGDRILAGLPASPLYGLPASDARDWPAIRAWARELAGSLA